MCTILNRLACVAAVLLIASCRFAAADEAAAAAKPEEKITYTDQVQPIFREHCYTCHNQNQAKSDLALDSFSRIMQGGASGAVVQPGDPDNSRLWQLVAHLDTPEMPPMQDKLPEAKLATIKQWIALGALENSGSTAKVKDKPKIDLAMSAGSSRPEGPPPMPENLSKQPAVYTPRAAAVTALAASPWAPLVAVAGQKQISLYNSDTAELLGVLPFPEGVPYVLKFSRSGSLLLAGGGHGAQRGLAVVFDVKTGQRVFEVGDELDAVLAADINEDHTKIALGGPSRVVRVYSAANGELLTEIRKHTEWIYSVEFSPDGVLLATADRTGGMFVWESETGREYQNLKAHTGAVTDVSWRLDSNILASTGEDGSIRLWEMENGGQVKSWGAHGGGSAAVKFTHDGRLVSTGRDRVTKVWDQNGSQLIAFEAFNDIALKTVFSHDGGRVVAGDWTGDVRMWNVADGKFVANLPANPPTLEMVSQAEATKAATAAAASQQLAAELAALEQAVAQKSEAARLAAEKAAASAADADKAEADKLAAEKAELEKQLAEKSVAAKAAADAAAAAQATAQRAAADLAAAPARS